MQWLCFRGAVLAMVVLASLVFVPGGSTNANQADRAVPAAASPDDEVIVITSAGQLRVDDPYTPTGYKPVSWNSGSEVGWTVVAGGDFNGDGDAELVAARGSIVKVFDPVVQAGTAPVAFTVDLGSQRNVRLLSTGDFDADGKDEFAVIHYIPGSGVQAGLTVYDGGANATASEWTRRNSAEYGAMFQDMSAGDFNADGADDLVLVRNVNTQLLVLAWNVRTWTTIAEGSYSRPWFAVAGGNISNSTPGDEIALLRDGGNAASEGLVLFRVVSGAFTDLVTNSSWKWHPDFVSISDGDLNGDGDAEVVMLRDPVNPTTSLLMVNPVGAAMNPFEQATGAGSAAFRIVRTGDTDGDGLDEIVILKGDRYRIYTEPNVDGRATETAGSLYTPGSVSNLPFMAVANVDGPGVVEGPTLSVTPASLSFSLDCGDVSPLKSLSITNSSTGSSFAWQAQAIEDQTVGTGSWLLIDATSGTTPGTVNVSVKNVTKGNYTGKIRITTTDPAVQNKTVDVPVAYASQCSGFVASPTTLNFNVPWGSPGLQSVTIGSAGPTPWTASVAPVAPTTSCNWLTLSATSGTTPSTVNVFANSVTAGVGSKKCSIILSAVDPSVPGSPQYVTVNLTVLDVGLVLTPDQVTIEHAVGGPPTAVQVLIERPGIPTQWAAVAIPAEEVNDVRARLAARHHRLTNGDIELDGAGTLPLDWLTFAPNYGTTPSTLTIEVRGNTAGDYRATIFVIAVDPAVPNRVRELPATAFFTGHAVYLPVLLK